MASPSIFNNDPQTPPGLVAPPISTPAPSDPSSIFGGGLWNELQNTKYNQSNPYTNAAHDAGGRSPANIAAISLAPAEYWNIAQQYGFHNMLSDTEHQAVQQYINDLMHPEKMSNEYRQAQLGAITGETGQLQNQLASAGAGQGAKEGAALSLFNNANRAANAYDANLASPTGKGQIAQGIVGAVESQNPNWQNEQNIASITNSTPRNMTGLQAAGNIIGEVAGSGAFGGGGIFGKSK